MADCIFCKIAKKEIASQILFEDSRVVAFPDINPVSPVHFLVIPKRHVEGILELNSEELTSIQAAIKIISSLCRDGFRVVNNFGKDGGQEVPHVHFHVLAGRKHSWPPG